MSLIDPAVNRWTSVCSSADGTKLATVSLNTYYNSGGLFRSQDSGITWSQQERGLPDLVSWYSVSCSADGSKLAAVGNMGVFISSTSGDYWSNQNVGLEGVMPKGKLPGYSTIAMSEDGMMIAVAVYIKGLFISKDGGASFALVYKTPDTWFTSGYWKSMAISAAGTNLVAVYSSDTGAQTKAYLVTSSDSGGSWQVCTSGLPVSSTGSDFTYKSVASSADGSHLILVASAAGRSRSVYVSRDGGVTWAVKSIKVLLNGAETVFPQGFVSVAISASGSNAVALSTSYGVFLSSDGGDSWTQPSDSQVNMQIGKVNPLAFSGVSISADGAKIAVAVFGDMIYVSNDAGKTWSKSVTSDPLIYVIDQI